MPLNQNEVQLNAQRINAGVAPVPYSLTSLQVSGGAAAKNVETKIFDRKTSTFDANGFQRATFDFFSQDVAELKGQEQEFFLKWQGIFQTEYGGNEGAFISDMLPFMQQDMASIYELKANTEAKQAKLVADWEKFQSDDWKDVKDFELLINGAGDPYTLNQLIGPDNVARLEGIGRIQPGSGENNVTKGQYEQLLHTLPGGTYDVLDYSKPDIDNYYKLKGEFLAKAKLGVEAETLGTGASVSTNQAALQQALGEWNERVSIDPALQRVHNMLFSQYAENVKVTYENMPDKYKQEYSTKRARMKEYYNRGVDDLNDAELNFYYKNYDEMVAYEYSGVGGISFMANPKGALRGTWQSNQNASDFTQYRDYERKAADPNNSGAGEDDLYKSNELAQLLRNDYRGFNLRGGRMSAGIIENSLQIDTRGWDHLDAEKVPKDADTDFSNLGKVIEKAGGLQVLIDNPAKSSELYWNNKELIAGSYLTDMYEGELQKINEAGKFVKDGKTYQVSVSAPSGSERGQKMLAIGAGLAPAPISGRNLGYNVTVDGKTTFYDTKGLLDLALPDDKKASAGVTNYLMNYASRSGYIDESTLQLAEMNNAVNATTESMKTRGFIALSIPYATWNIPGHNTDVMPGSQYFDIRDGVTKNIPFNGHVYHTDEVFIMQNEEGKDLQFVNANVVIDEESAELYSLPRPYEKDLTIAESDYKTVKELLSTHGIMLNNMAKERGIDLSDTDDDRTKAFFKSKVITGVPIRLSENVLRRGAAEINTWLGGVQPVTNIQLGDKPGL